MKRMLVVSLLLGAFTAGGFAQTASNDKTPNLRNCLEGFAECDRTQLEDTQQKQIAELQHDRNLWECLKGYGVCHHSVLSETESKEVDEAERLRNLPGLRNSAWNLRQNTSLAERQRKGGKARKRIELAALQNQLRNLRPLRPSIQPKRRKLPLLSTSATLWRAKRGMACAINRC